MRASGVVRACGLMRACGVMRAGGVTGASGVMHASGVLRASGVMCALLCVPLLACGPPTTTSVISLDGVTLDPVHSFSAMPRVTDEGACLEELFIVVTNQALDCDAYAAATEGVFVLEGENRFLLRLNRGQLDERRGTYDVLGGLLDPPQRQVFVSADLGPVNWRGFSGRAEVFNFDENGAAVSYSLELEENAVDGQRQSLSGDIVGEHCPALQDQLTRC